MNSSRNCERHHGRVVLLILVPLISFFCSLVSPSALAQDSRPPEKASEQEQIAERFLAVLEKNPRRGTALDKVYGLHVENGTLEAFVKQLEERIAANPMAGAAWMILGLIESQRGRDAAAAAGLAKASELRPADPLAAYYWGQALVLLGQADKAAAAFEEAIARKPAQADLLEIFQALGRVHQRAQRNQEALTVWSRLEKLFPGDERVQEQIATTLVEEGQFADALTRYQALVQVARDEYRRTVYRLETAELKVKVNRKTEAIDDLEQLLGALNPESWLFRDVRRKIEDVFLRTDDQDGLATYYEKWLQSHAEDIEAMARLARVLTQQARVPEASEWLTKALRLAPSRRDLRLVLIDHLIDDQKFADAIQQYAELDKLEPNNPDVLRDWGKLILRDGSRGIDQRRADAEKIWNRLLTVRPNEPLVATQVADLLRHADMQTQALTLYQKAVELAPAAPQYREYLGEYYHVLKRPDDALATWRQMAAGEARTATNLARLAEVLAHFGYREQALPEIAAACELEPRDLTLQLKAAELQQRGEQYDAAFTSLTRAAALAQNNDERELVLTQQIKCLELQGALDDRADALTKKVAGSPAEQRDWYLLARYREALHQYAEASAAITQVLKLAPADVPSLAAAARIAEQVGDLGSAAEQNRKLATIDRRGRSQYLEKVAGLEAQLGRIDAALAAGNELIVAAPGNVEAYQFFADLCFRLGRSEEGLAALRRATRTNPNEPNLLVSLATALANQFRPQEAIEIYWQAYDKERDLDGKLTVISRLADLYLQTNHFDRLLERLERGRREADQRREMTIALAQAYQSAGDFGMARQELETLLGNNTRDTTLLLQLSKLAESESDFSEAAKYQQQVVRHAPGNENEYRLASLLARAGDHFESTAIVTRLAAKETDRGKLLRSIDSLLGSNQDDVALGILEGRLRESPTDWELLYRQGALLAKREPVSAARAFEAILQQGIADEELGLAAKAQTQRENTATGGTAITGASGSLTSLSRLTYQTQIRSAVGLDADRISFAGSRAIWTPMTHGQARMAAMGWLYRFASDQKQADKFLAEWRRRIEPSNAAVRDLWDWLYLQTLRVDADEMKIASRRLAELGDVAGQSEFLQSTLRSTPLQSFEIARGQSARALEPLSPADLELAVKSFDGVRRLAGDFAIATNLTSPLLKQLRQAGKEAEAERIYRSQVTQAQTQRQLIAAMQIAAEADEFEQTLTLLDRFAKQSLQPNESKNAARSERTLMASVVTRLGNAKPRQPEDLLKLLDHFLGYEIAVASQQLDNPLARLSANTGAARVPLGVTVTAAGGVSRRVAMTYPTPNAYFDATVLTVLRSFFEQFKERDVVGDLRKHLDQQAAAAAGDKVFWLLASAYAQVWDDDVEKAFDTLMAALGLAPNDVDLRIDTARLFSQHQRIDEALALIDSVSPKDQKSLQQRETLALDLAVQLGDTERARQAAQQLFGLRLDVPAQVHLAGQMRRLGMETEANAVLSRSQRQAGSRPSALAALMQQYNEQGQTEQAVQIAQRIVRATRNAGSAVAGSPIPTSANSTNSADAQYRTAAIQVLSKAGKLKEVTAALEDQIRRRPTATQLYESLAEYYRLDGNNQKADALIAKLVDLKPEDVALRYRYAQDLYRQQKMAEACEQYKVVLQKQPQLIAQRYFEVTQAFQRARKESELVDVLSQIDLKALGQPFMVTNMLSTMMRTQQSRMAGMVLFKKAWEAFPAERARLIGYLGEEVWKLPEVIDYAKQTLRPNADQVRRDPWLGLQTGGISYSSNGQMTTGINRLLTAASQASQLDELRGEISAGIDENPNWLAGPVLLALVDLKQKKEVDIPSVAKRLLETNSTSSSLSYTRLVFAQEIESRPQYHDLAIQLYSSAMLSGNRSWPQFQFSPANRLMQLYKQAGRQREALELLRKITRDETSSSSPFAAIPQIRTQNLVEIGKQFEQLDAPADALALYRDVLNDNVGRVTTFASPANQPDFYKGLAQQNLKALLTKMGKRPQDVVALLTPDKKRPAGAPVIDLMLDASPTPGTPLKAIDCPLVQIVHTSNFSAEQQAVVTDHLRALSESYPDDLSIPIVTALFALKHIGDSRKQNSFEELLSWLERFPLEELPGGQRPTSRQRTEAASQVALWLVARECLPLDTFRSTGEKLAERAIAAARRQADQGSLLAILHEWGRVAAKAGDKQTAERRWNELIDVTLVQPRQARGTNSTKTSGPQTGGTARPTGSLAATSTQFAIAATIAQVAAEHDLVDVSLRSMREALSGGMPLLDAPSSVSPTAGRGFASALPVVPAPPLRLAPGERLTPLASPGLWQLSVVWKQHNFPPSQVFQMLASLVFPVARPGEVVLPDQPQANELITSRSMGAILVEWASQADHGVELKRQVAARQASPADIKRGRLLLIELSIAEKDPAAAGPHLTALASELDKSTFKTLETRVAQITPATPAPQQPAAEPKPKTASPQPSEPKSTPVKAAEAAGNSPVQPNKNLEAWWNDLELTEAVAARALLHLADYRNETVAYMKSRLKPLKISAERVQMLLVDLGSEKEDVWKAAYAEFEYFDPRLAIDLQTLMDDVTTSPARQRLVEILSQRPPGSLADKDVSIRKLGSGNDGYNFFDGRSSWWAEHRTERLNTNFSNSKRKWTRAVRAIIVLEHIGTPEAIAVLQEMGTGNAEAQPTKIALEALERLTGKPK